MGNFLRRYITLRQEEGAFYKCDPDVAMVFFCGSVVQYAMTRHLFGAKTHPHSDEIVTAELVELVSHGLLWAAGTRRKRPNHAK